MYYTLLLHFLIDVHLGFPVGTIKNQAPEDNFCTSFWTHVFLFVCFFSKIS